MMCNTYNKRDIAAFENLIGVNEVICEKIVTN